MPSIAQNMHLSEPTTKIWMKTDAYYRWQKCRWGTLVSSRIRFIWIFAEVPWRWDVKQQWGCRRRLFSVLLLTMSSEPLEVRPPLLYRTCSPSSPFHWSKNMWPWVTFVGHFTFNSVFMPVHWAWEFVAFKDNCMQTNKDRSILGHSIGHANV